MRESHFSIAKNAKLELARKLDAQAGDINALDDTSAQMEVEDDDRELELARTEMQKRERERAQLLEDLNDDDDDVVYMPKQKTKSVELEEEGFTYTNYLGNRKISHRKLPSAKSSYEADEEAKA